MPRLESHRGLGVVLLAVLLVLAGCSGAGGGGGGAGQAAPESLAEREASAGGADGAESAAGGDADGGSGGDALQVRRRQVIRTGDVTVRVESYDAARRNLTAAARDLGGFVSDSSRRRHEVRAGTYVTGTVTLRVPRDWFGAMMDRAEGVGTVRSSTVRSKDVTDQLVDIDARLRNLRAQRERLRTLYEEANDTEAVLEVQRRLSETQERIERLEAKKRTLERRVAYSTIRVELREERPEPGPREIRKWYDVPLVGAFLESVHGVVIVARAAAVLAAYALPYLLAFGLPPVLLAALGYRRWRGSGGDGEDGAPGDDPDDEDGGALRDAPESGDDAGASGDDGDGGTRDEGDGDGETAEAAGAPEGTDGSDAGPPDGDGPAGADAGGDADRPGSDGAEGSAGSDASDDLPRTDDR
ncbi:MAG: DUF4349 domain-containing protein [Haloferacaceae archaeon]